MTLSLKASRTVLWSLVAVALALACSPRGGPQVDSQTNWLKACQVDDDCGSLLCVCGSCTATCNSDQDCADLDGASCVASESAEAVALCGGEAPQVSGVCLPVDPTAHVAIDASTQFQTLVGFGASVGWVGQEITSHPQKDELYQAMFGDSGFEFLRLRNHYGYTGEDDLTIDSGIFEGATEKLGHPPIVLLTSWSPPPELKANGATQCQGNPDTCTLTQLDDGSFDYAGFAAHWRASLEAYASLGISPDYIGIQNNPNWVPPASDGGKEACRFLPTEGTTTVDTGGAEIAYPGFREALSAVVAELSGLPSVPKIVAPEATGVRNVSSYTPYMDFASVAAVGHHMYGTDPENVDLDALKALSELGQELERPLFQTEMESDGFGTAVLMHYALAVEGAAAYLQNDFASSAIALTPNPYALISLSADSFTLQPAYQAMRHYSLHTAPGWVRVAATADVPDLLVSAWVSPEQDALTIVLSNAGSNALEAEVSLDEFGVDLSSMTSEVTRTVFGGSVRSASLGELSPDAVLRIPSRAMVTVALQR